MADWFAELMQRGHARAQRAVVGPEVEADTGGASTSSGRDARYDGIVQRLRERQIEERDAREKRQRWYRQTLETDSVAESTEATSSSPVRLHRLRTKVPCRTMPEGRALLDELRKRFAGCTISFSPLGNGQQAMMLSGRAGATRRQIGWIEHCVEADPKRCNVSNHGLSVETDGGSMLVLRFRYPSTAVNQCSNQSDTGTHVDFAELRPALDLRPSEEDSSPRLVWLTRHELETMNALRSRDYEAFYLRFKLEVQAGMWSSLLGLLSSWPGSLWHQGSCYTVLREPDASIRKIQQRTVDDSGHRVDVGQDRTFDAAAATDILLLYLDGDILADVADIYFTLQGLGSTDAYFLKEEFFTVIRRFWENAQSLTSLYGSDHAAIVRMSQRAVPMPAQAPMLKQEWSNLRQCLVDRYGEGGQKAVDLPEGGIHLQRVAHGEWPFSSAPASEVNIGLRLIYRQEWRHIGTQRGEVIRSTPLGAAETESRIVETSVERGLTARNLREVVSEVTTATVEATRWPVDLDGRIQTGARDLAATTERGLEVECRQSCRDTSLRLSEIALTMANSIRDEAIIRSIELEKEFTPPPSTDVESVAEVHKATCAYRLHDVYEVLTRPAEIQNVVLIAEKLPTPAEIDRAWVSRHDWLLAKVLLDESFRDALDTISSGAEACEHDVEVEAKRTRFYEHVRANILHYQRAIWQQEDPQQRSMRYRKLGKKVPLEWRFELESRPELTIDALADRLTATNVDGHFAAYAPGREVDLDQLIDPAGLIGYHGNYAIFRMRPEFGSGDLFSMLHFFKSPYLRPNPEMGEPDVDDPERIQMSEDPAVMRVDDADHRFRRERARTFSLKTSGVVIDVFHSIESAEDLECSNSDVRPNEAPVGCELVLDGAAGVELLSSMGHDSKLDSPIVLCREEGLLAGSGDISAHAQNSSANRGIAARAFGDPRPTLCVGQTGDSEKRDEVPPIGDAARVASLVTGVGALAGERVMQSRVDEERSTGRSYDPKAACGILTRHDRDSTFMLPRRAEAAGNEEIRLSLGEEKTPGKLGVGRPQLDSGQVILEPESGGRRLSSGIGGGAARAHERVILAAGDVTSTANLVAGAGTSNEYEHMILAQDDEWLMPSLVVG